jgi:putative transcription factor
MQCDMCGSEISNPVRTLIEGVELNVCGNCSRYGKVLPPKAKPSPAVSDDDKRKIFERVVNKRELMLVLDENYSEIVKKAREERGYKQIELAKKINERESVIQNIEHGKFEPPLAIARKLEKLLGISIIKEHVEEHGKKFDHSPSEKFTIGDFVVKRRR